MLVEEIKNDKLEKHLKIVVQEEVLQEKVSNKMLDLVQKIRLPGFRPGKAPLNLIRKKYETDVRNEVVSDEIQKCVKESIESLNLASEPKIDNLKKDIGIEFVLKLELMPKVTIPDFHVINLEKFIIDIDENEVDKHLQQIAENNKTFDLENTKTITNGDKVIVDFCGTVEGKDFANNTSENYELIIGEQSVMREFSEQLTGAKWQDEVDVKVSYPETHKNSQLAGKEVVFKTKIKEIYRPLIPQINDELAKKLLLDNLEALKIFAKKELEQEYQTQSDTLLKVSFFNKLENMLTFDIPQTLINQEKTLLSSGIYEEDKDIKLKLDKIISRRIRIGLLLAEYAKQQNIKMEQSDIQKALLQEVKKYPDIAKEITQHYYKNQSALERLAAPFFEDKVVKFIFTNEKINIIEKHCSIQEFEKIEEKESEYE